MGGMQQGGGLVGRDELLREILDALYSPAGFGALVVGEAGVGKTALARAVAAEFNGSSQLFLITGGSSLREIPFGALSPYLHDLSVNDVASPVAILRSLLKNFPPAKENAPPPLFVVDDAHDLDDSSCALLSQLASARRVKLLVLTRPSPATPAEFLALSDDGLLFRFDVEPLDPRAVEALCRQELGGPVLTGTARMLAQTTGGNPLFLLTLLKQGAGQGHLVEKNGVWRMVGGQPEVDLRLVDLILNQLRQRAASDMAALEMVALAEPVSFKTISRCVNPDALQRLQDDHLVTVGAPPNLPVSLSHPLYGEVIRSQVPTARSIALRRAMLSLGSPQTESLEGFLRSVSWGLDCGVPPDDRDLLQAAVVANRLYDHGFALRAARAVSAPGLRGRALVEIARAQIARGNLGYAAELIDEALDGCTDFDVAKEASLLSVDVRVRGGEPPANLRRDADRWSALIDRIEAAQVREGPSSPAAILDAAATSRLGCRLLLCYILILEGRILHVEQELRAALGADHGTPETEVGALALLGELLGSTGRAVQGAAATGRALALIDATGHRLLAYREFVMARHLLVLVHAGAWAEAEAAFDEYARLHPRNVVYFSGWYDLFQGAAALRGGRTTTARNRLLLAVEGIRESDPAQVLTMVLGLAAYACAVSGEKDRAEVLIDEGELTAARGSREMRLTGRIYRLAAGSIIGQEPEAAAALRKIADSAAADGLLEVAATALEQAARLGDTAAYAPLAALTETFEGSEGAVVHAFAAARRNNTPAGLTAAADLAIGHGYLPIAVASLKAAAELWTSRGAHVKARNVQAKLASVLAKTEEPVQARAESSGKLTRRERDIVSLVAQGYTNREVADKQSVSVRTVEGHLYRIFAKLGITRREDLKEIDRNL